MFFIVGMGPGNLNCTTSKAFQCVMESDVVIGAGRLLEDLKKVAPNKRYVMLQMPYEPMIEYIRTNHENLRIVVVVTGDSGFYSLSHYIGRHFSKENYTVYPGISSLQYLFAAIKEPWQQAALLSLHGKEAHFVEAVKKHRFVGLLTDQHHPPQWICTQLMDHEINHVQLHIGENLSYEEERIQTLNLSEVCERSFDSLLVVIVENLEIE